MQNLTVFAMLSVAVLGALLLGATAAQHQQDQRALVAAERQIEADASALAALTVQLRDARAALERTPTETLVTVTAPCREPRPRVVPVFSRDSQLTGGQP